MLKKITLDENQIKEYINNALSSMRTDVSPEELNEYRRIYRKYVPFNMRAYLGAFLVREALGGGATQERHHGTRTVHKGNPKIVLSPEVSTSLFVSVGKKRRVFPKDLITLIMQNVEIPREHIGEIKILDNYSFVQIMSTSAPAVIEKLNRLVYRGRELAVSYAHDEPAYAKRG